MCDVCVFWLIPARTAAPLPYRAPAGCRAPDRVNRDPPNWITDKEDVPKAPRVQRVRYSSPKCADFAHKSPFRRNKIHT